MSGFRYIGERKGCHLLRRIGRGEARECPRGLRSVQQRGPFMDSPTEK